MKNIFKLLVTCSILLSCFSCGEEGFEIVGRVKSFEHMGFKCWTLIDSETNHYYELVSGDENLLVENNKVTIRIEFDPNAKTICNVGDKVRVISYRLRH